MPKESIPRFLWRRYSTAFGFAGNIILAAIAIGILCNILDAYTHLSWEAISGIAEVLMILLVAVSIFVMFSKRKLNGPLGKMQNQWNRIPTWRSYEADLKKEEKNTISQDS